MAELSYNTYRKARQGFHKAGELSIDKATAQGPLVATEAIPSGKDAAANVVPNPTGSDPPPPPPRNSLALVGIELGLLGERI